MPVIVDFHAYLGDWPTYTLRNHDATGLLRLMDRCGIGAACVSLAGGMLHHDAREANERLCREIGPHGGRLWPIGTLNPCAATGQDDLVDGLERLGIHGFRLHPSYHGYRLREPVALELTGTLAGRRCPLFIARMVDEPRFQHPALRAPEVPLDDLAALAAASLAIPLVINGLKTADALTLVETGMALDNVYLDVSAMDQGLHALRSLAARCGAGRLVFGSQMPFLLPEAALMVVANSGLGQDEIEMILERNAQATPFLQPLDRRTEV
ncbi:MAG: amidohydrolase family protein [Anaerolineae bacterium]